MMLAVIEHYQQGDKLLFPLRFRVYGEGFSDETRGHIDFAPPAFGAEIRGFFI
jgi:hypothetical protein